MGGQLGIMLDTLFYGFDTAVYSFFWKFQNAFTIGIADFCQYLGNSTAFIMYFAVSLLLCFPKKTRKFGVAMVVAFFVAFLLVNVLTLYHAEGHAVLGYVSYTLGKCRRES